MGQQQNTIEQHTSPAEHPHEKRRAATPRSSFAAKLFGYDIFISFALGPPPRGTHSYASDLARRLRELDYTVFFSEDDAPVGNQLDSTLRKALRQSHALVIVANREMLGDPRWVRAEVEVFYQAHPHRPIIPIFIGEVLQDKLFMEKVGEWLPYEGSIWVNESVEAAIAGIVSDTSVERLATAPKFRKSSRWWRLTIAGTMAILFFLAIGLGISTMRAIENQQRAVRADDEAKSNLLQAQRNKQMAEKATREAEASQRDAELATQNALESKKMAERADEEAKSNLLQAQRNKDIAAKARQEAEASQREAELATQNALESKKMAEEARRTETALRLNAEAQAILSASRGGGDVLGLLTLLAAHRVFNHVEIKGMLLSKVLEYQSLQKVVEGNLAFYDVTFSPDGTKIVTASWDGTLRFWDAQTANQIGLPLKSKEALTNVAFSPDGTTVVSGGWNGTLEFWDVNTGQSLRQLVNDDNEHGVDRAITSVAFSPDSSTVVTGSFGKVLRLWDVKTGQPIGVPLKGHAGPMRSVAFSPDGNTVVAGGDDKALWLWDVRTARPIGVPLKGHDALVTSVAFSPDGSTVVSGSYDKTLRLWDVKSGQAIGVPLRGHDDGVNRVAFNHDGSTIISASKDRTLRLWDVKTKQPFGAPLRTHSDSANSVAFNPDGTKAASVSVNGAVWLWNIGNGMQIGAPLNATDHSGSHSKVSYSAVYSVAFSPDGSTVVSGHRQTLRLWDVKTGQPIGTPLRSHSDEVRTVAFGPGGNTVVAGGGGFDGRVRLWNTNVERYQDLIWDIRNSVKSLVFSPDGSMMISVGTNRTLQWWDARTGSPIGMPTKGYSGEMIGVGTIRDGSIIAFEAENQTLRLWDVKTGQPVGTPLKANLQSLRSVALSPDGDTVAVGSDDNSFRLWDIKTGQPVGPPLKGHNGTVMGIAFSRDGNRIVSGSTDGTIRLWPAPTTYAGMLCAKLTRNMSRKEWHEHVSPDYEYVEQCPGLPIPGDE